MADRTTGYPGEAEPLEWKYKSPAAPAKKKPAPSSEASRVSWDGSRWTTTDGKWVWDDAAKEWKPRDATGPEATASTAADYKIPDYDESASRGMKAEDDVNALFLQAAERAYRPLDDTAKELEGDLAQMADRK